MPAEHIEREQWYALYVRAHFERAAERCLKRKGYPAFSPFYQTIRKRSGRTKVLDLPLFPGYVFCSFNPNKRLPILTTPGVVNIVGAGHVPQTVELSEIRSIRTVADSGQPVTPWPFLPEGQKIRIEAGPLLGAEGTLVRVKNQLRLVVSITLLQRSMSVEVDQEVVRPLFGYSPVTAPPCLRPVARSDDAWSGGAAAQYPKSQNHRLLR
jgi:transcription termination/antitermination protein NusG